MTRSPMTSSKRLGNRAPSILPPMPYYEKIRQETPAPITMYLEPSPDQSDTDWDRQYANYSDRLKPRAINARFWVEPSLYAFFDHAWGEKEYEPTAADFFRQDWGIIGAEGFLRRTMYGRGTKRARISRGNLDLPDFSQRIRDFVLKKREEGRTVIGFKRAAQAFTQWHDSQTNGFAFNWKPIKSPVDIEDRRIYLGHVMPLYKAKVIAKLDGVEADPFIEDTVIDQIKKSYTLDSLGHERGSVDNWPIVLTMDNGMTPLQKRDEVVDIYGNIVYRHQYSEAHIRPFGDYSGILKSVDVDCKIFDPARKREILDPARKEIAERNGWPNSPLSPVLAVINKDDPFKVQLEKAQREDQKRGMPLARPLYK